MISPVNLDNLRSFTYINEDSIVMPIRGIIVSFPGMGGQDFFTQDTPRGKFFGERGILYVLPYNNPWAWMNAQAFANSELIMDLVFEKFNLPETTPIAITGLSMGGHGALMYSMRSKRQPVACVLNCPACNMVSHVTERPELLRALHDAYYHEDGTIQEIMERNSPLCQAEHMPKIRYHIFHCDQDELVNIHTHSETFVARMRQLGHQMNYHVIPDRPHCEMGPDWEVVFREALLSAFV